MKLTIAQINATVGDLSGNVERCLHAWKTAAAQETDLVIFPEMVIPGYPPRDILYDPSFAEAVELATADLAAQGEGLPPALVGTFSTHIPNGFTPVNIGGHPGLFNIAALLQNGTVTPAAYKQLLPIYDVFYEPRWFRPGPQLPPIEIAGKKIGVVVCEDMWDAEYDVHPPAAQIAAGAELLINLSASPFRLGMLDERARVCTRDIPVMYVNLVGATDELIFDGRSFVMQNKQITAQAAGFQEDILTLDLDAEPTPIPTERWEKTVYDALVLGVRDFAQKNGLKRAALGLSGGVDSALVAVIAADALGGPNVTTVAIPSRYSDPRSTSSAQELATQLDMQYAEVPLDEMHKAAETSLETLLDGGNTAENIQARLRMLVLTSYVNAQGGLLLNTSNKTELAMGYSTLYGDMAGSVSPLGDLNKTQVYAVARWLHETRGVIPAFILDRAPSAELRPDQVDPFDYEKISPELDTLVEANQSSLPIRRSEHKRWLMGIILKVSRKAFGTGRLIPVTRR